jgi:hypothetical protein
MLGSQKEALSERRFVGNNEVKDAVHTWLRSKPKNVIANGVRRPVNYNKIHV